MSSLDKWVRELYAADDEYTSAVYMAAQCCAQSERDAEREIRSAKLRVSNAERAIIGYLREARPRS